MKFVDLSKPLRVESERSMMNPIPGARQFPGVVQGFYDVIEAWAKVAHEEVPEPRLLNVDSLKFDEADMKSLRAYQREGVEFIVKLASSTGGALISDDMGLGKTRQALIAAKKLRRDTANGVSLIVVVCPAGVREQWVKEWHEVNGPIKAHIVYSSKDADKIDPSHEMIVVSYGLIEKVSAKLKRVPEIAIFDEFHRVKGRAKAGKGVKRTVALKNLAALSRVKIGITGTPVWSRLKDFWQLLDILWPWRFGKAFDFDVRYANGRFGTYGFINDGASNVAELQKRLSYYMIRRTKEEVAKELPAITRQIRWVDPNPTAAKLFRSFEIGRKSGEAMFNAIEATLDDKVQEVVDIASELDTFLVVTWMKRHAYEIAEKLEKEGKKVAIITGDDTAKKRRQIIDECVRTKTSIVATLGSVSEGIDGIQQLTSNGIFHALSWVPAELKQAEGRLHRIRQVWPVTWIYVCMRESADEWILNTIVKRLDVWQTAVAGGKDIDVHHMRSALSAKSTDDEMDKMLSDLWREGLPSDGQD